MDLCLTHYWMLLQRGRGFMPDTLQDVVTEGSWIYA